MTKKHRPIDLALLDSMLSNTSALEEIRRAAASIQIPKLDFPRIDVPKFDMPKFDIDRSPFVKMAADMDALLKSTAGSVLRDIRLQIPRELLAFQRFESIGDLTATHLATMPSYSTPFDLEECVDHDEFAFDVDEEHMYPSDDTPRKPIGF